MENSRKWLYAGAGITLLALSGYLVYKYTCSGANDIDCIFQNTAFRKQIKLTASQNAKEKKIEKWLKENLHCYPLISYDEPKNSTSTDTQNSHQQVRPFKRQCSKYLYRGTGKYQCVNKEDIDKLFTVQETGCLKYDHFNHLQQVIEVYSKVMLHEMRKQHTRERAELFKQRDFEGYIKLVLNQQEQVLKKFNKLTTKILLEANIKTVTFHQTVNKHVNESEASSIRQSAKLSVYTLFKEQPQYQSITRSEIEELQDELTGKAIEIMTQNQLCNYLTRDHQVFVLYDCLMQDLLFEKENGQMTIDDYNAILFKYSIQEQNKDKVETICEKLEGFTRQVRHYSLSHTTQTQASSNHGNSLANSMAQQFNQQQQRNSQMNTSIKN